MFVTNNERTGSGYIEFQFCKKKKPYFCGKLVGYKFWSDDSIFLDVDDFENKYIDLYPLLKKIDSDFSILGLSYFNKEQTISLLEDVEKSNNNNFAVLVEFLKIAIERYNGIYIIGV